MYICIYIYLYVMCKNVNIYIKNKTFISFLNELYFGFIQTLEDSIKV